MSHPRSRSTQGTEANAAIVPVTAIVLTKNEEINLPDCLRSLAGWVQETFVVDSGSTDRTREIAAAFGARVVEHPFENYGAQRNWALRSLSISTPWVLNIDADERVTGDLQASIASALGTDELAVQGYLVSRRTMFMGRWMRHGGHYPAWHLRLFRTGRGRCEDRLYDQHFIVKGVVERLPGDLVDTFTPDLQTFSRQHLRWAAFEADEQDLAPDTAGRIRGRLRSGNAIEARRWFREGYERLPLFIRPFLYFLYRYLIRLGFLDGREGLVFHVLQGFWYRFLVDSLIFERRVRSRGYRPGTGYRPAARPP